MTLRIPSELVEPMVAGLLGGIDVDGGPTPEQLAVLRALTTHLWGRPDLELTGITPAGPEETAAHLIDPIVRRRFHEMHVTLESCRHPQSSSQVAQVELYAEVLGTPGPDLLLFRRYVDDGAERAMGDAARFLDATLGARVEPPLRDLAVSTTAPEPDLYLRLMAFESLDEGSLGRAFLDHYERNGIPLPGLHASAINHFFVGHDMTHVIAGLTTTALGEVALSAFQMGMDDNDLNIAALLASLVCHEAGFGTPGTFATEDSTLAAPGAADLFGRELARGSACAGDFSLVDHFALAPLPLTEVRGMFGVRPPEAPDDGHHHW